MTRELKLFAYFAAGILAARLLVLAVDAVAESLERRALYR
jgi:hypothetical protein